MHCRLEHQGSISPNFYEVHPPIFICQWPCCSEQHLFPKPFQVGANSFPAILSLLCAVPGCVLSAVPCTPGCVARMCEQHPAQGPQAGRDSFPAGQVVHGTGHPPSTPMVLLQTDVSSLPKAILP